MKNDFISISKKTFSFDDDFRVHMKENNIPLQQQPFFSPHGVLGLCLDGNAVIDVYMQEYHVSKGGLIVILPNQLISVKEKDEDFKMNYFVVSQGLINEIVSGISRLSPLFFIHMRKKHYYNLTDDEIYRYEEYYNLIFNRINSQSTVYIKEYIVNTLRLFYLDLYNNFKNSLLTPDEIPESRKEKLAYNFFILIIEHYKKNREVSYYANKLYITPKYLSTIIKDVSGRSAKEWIDEYSMLEIKYLLANTNKNIQEVALEMNFSNQASLGRFFRTHTGMSPSEYRTTKKINQ